MKKLNLIALCTLFLTACSGGSGKNVGTDSGSSLTPAGSTPQSTIVNQVSNAAVKPRLTLTNRSNSTISNTPLTFGYLLSQGDFPAGQQFAISVSGQDELIPLQTDAKATHADGTLRHAIFSVQVPHLGAEQQLNAELVPVDAAPNLVSSSLNELLNSGWDAKVELDVVGDIYSASAKALLQNSASQWLSGSIVNEWTTAGALTSGSGAAHPHLAAQFSVRVYGQLDKILLSVVVENNWAFEDNPRNLTYDATVIHNGSTVFTESNLVHLRHSRWRKQFWSDNEPPLHIAHDADYLIKTGALPNFSSSLIGNISESQLVSYDTVWKDESVVRAVDDGGYLVAVGSGGHEFSYNKIGPMGIGLANGAMPTTGARPDIGPLPQWNAVYLLSQDFRAKEVALGMGDLSGSWPIHYRDKNTRLPVSLDDYPYVSNMWDINLSKNPNTGLNEHVATCSGTTAECVLPYRADTAHQPSLVYLPYLVSGDFYYLEELHFWASYNFVSMNPSYREKEKGLFSSQQDRGQAWSMRTLGHAAYITPDAHPMKQYFESKLQHNFDFYDAKYVVGNPNGYGALEPKYSYPTGSPWMDDFFTWSIGSLADMGYAKAKPIRDWKAQFPIQRMGLGSQNDNDYCWVFAPAYHILIAPDSSSPMFDTIADVYDNTNGQSIPYGGAFDDQGTECASQAQADALGLEKGEMIGYSSSPTGFPSNLQIALAVAADSQAQFGRDAWNRFESRSIKPDYSAYPNYAIVPRTQ